MAARSAHTPTDEVADEALNDVRLRGRLAAAAEQRTLPSGDVVVRSAWWWTAPHDRCGRRRRHGSTPSTAPGFATAVRRRCLQWKPGDVLEVQGSLRRRFFRTGGGPASRYEVEVASATRVSRAAG